MTATVDRHDRGFDFVAARDALLRYQPSTNWVTVSHDPARRLSIGYGFDVNRSDAPELLRRVGLDAAAVRAGRVPITDAQMEELFDLSLHAAVDLASDRIPGFLEMAPQRQWALLELGVRLGPRRCGEIFSHLEAMGLQLTDEAPAPSPWLAPFSRPRRGAADSPGMLDAAFTVTFDSFGVIAELVCDDAELFDAACQMLPPGWAEVDAPPVTRFGIWCDGIITVDGTGVWRSDEPAAGLLRLGAIVRHHVAAAAEAVTFVHAGVVEVDGCGIVIPGRSHSGKSTLVAELVRLGATYASDEYAVLDPDGWIQPFAKPLSIRGTGADPFGRLVPAPEGQIAREPVRAGLIVLTAYVPGVTWDPSPRSPAEAGFALLQNAVSARQRPAAALTATSCLARDAVCVAGPRGEAAEAAPALLGLALLRAKR